MYICANKCIYVNANLNCVKVPDVIALNNSIFTLLCMQILSVFVINNSV